MIGSKQTNYALIQVKQRLLFLKQKQKNYKTSHFQIKWSKNSYKSNVKYLSITIQDELG